MQQLRGNDRDREASLSVLDRYVLDDLDDCQHFVLSLAHEFVLLVVHHNEASLKKRKVGGRVGRKRTKRRREP